MNLKLISDDEIIFDLKTLISDERELLTSILRYLKEVEIRKIYLQKGFSSMFAYLTEELGYSEGAAQRRIQAMRLLKDLPEIEPKIQTGEISLSVASQIQSYLRKEEKKAPIKKEEKLELINDLGGISARECERKLIKLSPETALPSEKTRPITDEITLIQFLANKDLMNMIQRAKELTSHQNPEGKHDKLFTKSLALLIKTLDPAQREARRTKKNHTPSRSSKSLLHISGKRPVRSQWPATVGKALPRDDQNPSRITTKSPPTSAVVPASPGFGSKDPRYFGFVMFSATHRSSKDSLENNFREGGVQDPAWPVLYGGNEVPSQKTSGEHSEGNLQLRCREHNLYRAEILLG